MSFKSLLKELFGSKSRGDVEANGPLTKLPLAEEALKNAQRIDTHALVRTLPTEELLREIRVHSDNAYASAITPN